VRQGLGTCRDQADAARFHDRRRPATPGRRPDRNRATPMTGPQGRADTAPNADVGVGFLEAATQAPAATASGKPSRSDCCRPVRTDPTDQERSPNSWIQSPGKQSQELSRGGGGHRVPARVRRPRTCSPTNLISISRRRRARRASHLAHRRARLHGLPRRFRQAPRGCVGRARDGELAFAQHELHASPSSSRPARARRACGGGVGCPILPCRETRSQPAATWTGDTCWCAIA
jgi:hypothetical protein